MPAPLAYLLTWTCHGSWLHGDERGSVDRLHSVPFTPVIAPSAERWTYNAKILSGDGAIVLNSEARGIVDATIRDHCERRRWNLHAKNVRTNHVHVVVSAHGYTPEVALQQFKQWCTRRLRARGLFSEDQLIWTDHGSTPYLWDEQSVAYAMDYVANRQGAALE